LKTWLLFFEIEVWRLTSETVWWWWGGGDLAPPQVPYSTTAAAMQGLNILLLLYTLATQVTTILFTKDSPYIKNRLRARPRPRSARVRARG
jgi:hypothetical protein